MPSLGLDNVLSSLIVWTFVWLCFLCAVSKIVLKKSETSRLIWCVNLQSKQTWIDTAATEAAAAVAESTAASALAEEEVRPVSSKRPYESSSRDDYPREDDRKRSRADQPCYRCGGISSLFLF